MDVLDLEEAGVWLGSELGVSFACRCGWRSGIQPSVVVVREMLDDHAANDHLIR